jgi:alpha-galactosidase
LKVSGKQSIEMTKSLSLATAAAVLTLAQGSNALVRPGNVVRIRCSCSSALRTSRSKTQQGKLPALGWNSWNAFGCDIDAAKIMTAANEVVNLGLKGLGYEYINSELPHPPPRMMLVLTMVVDDCWSVKSGRDASTQRIIPDPGKFPDGISGVANQIHDLGLKVGIYSSESLPIDRYR